MTRKTTSSTPTTTGITRPPASVEPTQERSMSVGVRSLGEPAVDVARPTTRRRRSGTSSLRQQEADRDRQRRRAARSRRRRRRGRRGRDASAPTDGRSAPPALPGRLEERRTRARGGLRRSAPGRAAGAAEGEMTATSAVDVRRIHAGCLPTGHRWANSTHDALPRPPAPRPRRRHARGLPRVALSHARASGRTAVRRRRPRQLGRGSRAAAVAPAHARAAGSIRRRRPGSR